MGGCVRRLCIFKSDENKPQQCGDDFGGLYVVFDSRFPDFSTARCRNSDYLFILLGPLISSGAKSNHIYHWFFVGFHIYWFLTLVSVSDDPAHFAGLLLCVGL